MKPVTLLSVDEATENGKMDIWDAFRKALSLSRSLLVLLIGFQDSTFKDLLEDYLASTDDCKIHTLEDLIKFNKEHAEQELPSSESYYCRRSIIRLMLF